MLITLEKKKKYNFLYQLKENNIISSYTFTIKFYKENYGEIIIGDYPHNYNDNFFSGDFKYTLGEYVFPDSFNPDRWMESTHGIHFWMTPEEAIAY